MRVFEVMSDRVSTVTPATPVAAARLLMDTIRAGHLVVTMDRRVVGIVTRQDLSAPGASVEDVMTSPAVTVEKTATVRKAANLMQGRGIGCLPVTDRGRLAGIVTTTDLLRLVGRGIDRPQPPARRTANHRVPHRKAHAATGRW
jgi:tRNA nucleotidyltransferase (CCA-adding enzyme)